jgi:hypothetical protein
LWVAFLDLPSIFAEKNATKKFNVYKNQQSRQTGSRNLMGPKTLPTIWGTNMKLVTKYQICVISATIDGRNVIFGHKLHIGMPYCGKRFWTRQIPTSCLLTWLVFIHIEPLTSIIKNIFQ